VSLISLSSVTHAFDANQRFMWLNFSRTSTSVNVKLPALKPLAPPGYYMLFILNGNGVPSVGKMLRLR
jgi:hypothetical protein